MAQLTEEQLFWSPGPDLNSIAIIVRHLAGNMDSRWTNFLTEDGEKTWRRRDAEFEPPTDLTGTELMRLWEEGWETVFEALQSLTAADLEKAVAIRGREHTVTEAIHRQLSHYGYHIGQIVFIAHMRKGVAWETLSIAKGKSNEYRPGQKD